MIRGARFTVAEYNLPNSVNRHKHRSTRDFPDNSEGPNRHRPGPHAPLVQQWAGYSTTYWNFVVFATPATMTLTVN
jgi:hypothetical protein